MGGHRVGRYGAAAGAPPAGRSRRTGRAAAPRLARKLVGWSDTTGGIASAFSRDEILTWVSAYWLTNTIGTSFSPYVEAAKPAGRVEAPTVVSSFAHDILPAPRSYAELFLNVQDFVEHPAGGHFAAWEQPAAYAADLDRAVRLGQGRPTARSLH